MRVKRLLNIIVTRWQDGDYDFSAAVPTALREYADAVEKDEKGNNDHESFETSNGCRIVVIGGSEITY